MSLNFKQPTPVTQCRVPPCKTNDGSHRPAEDPGQEITKAPQTVTKVPHPQPCQCSPEQLRELLEQALQAGKTANLKSTGCGGGAINQLETPAPPPAPVSTPASVPSNILYLMFSTN